MRARDLGITIGTGRPGPRNAITDVAGVRVGMCTLVRGDGPLRPGEGPVRTGVTMVLPHADGIWDTPVFAGSHRLNGNGEVTGLEWVRESGTLSSPIGLTNSHSVGVVRDAIAAIQARERPRGQLFWAIPVVGETWDGVLNDVNGFHLGASDAWDAYAAADDGPVAEGNVGGGTGMTCHGFKGGTGTSSRRVDEESGGWTVGVLVQANHGRRGRLTVNGAPVGREIDADVVPLPAPPELRPGGVPAEGGGSVIVVVATDAPLLPHQCDRLAQRAMLGIARTGGTGEHSSGDFAVAFATGNRLRASDYGAVLPLTQPVTMLSDAHIDPLFDAAVEATEEAVVNALVAARTMTGRDGVVAHGLPHDRLVKALDGYGLRTAERARS
ncbi:L-aminopeptidase DmpA. Serine peptidase. MEROPS family S58 [Blastococcus sp. DSM 46786]|uniref:DmpA family aminopeptidase n=1 Tax=Blastococcus sp. DSM 46786 TaxID=1798227 RepID=UPI0008BA2706|nr:P1 family peptidase [Blastococcus sp. DSM 46786]SEL66137.1 L-aminopeptidase DmpA. Serine peptidase. MEROPS family S58 [Blastococcus sp. DSM 46786]